MGKKAHRPVERRTSPGLLFYTVRTSLLIDEQPLQVCPSLAVAIGLNHAIFLQQLHWFTMERPGYPVCGTVLDDGHRYIYNTYEQWSKVFPFWDVRTIRRIITDLEHDGRLETRQGSMNLKRMKWYRVSDSAKAILSKEMLKESLELLSASKKPLSEASGQIVHKHVDKMDRCSNINRETNTKRHIHIPNQSSKEDSQTTRITLNGKDCAIKASSLNNAKMRGEDVVLGDGTVWADAPDDVRAILAGLTSKDIMKSLRNHYA